MTDTVQTKTAATLYTSRNDALGFAERTRKNLEHIVSGFNAGEDVHVVTQLINSLLGLVVFLHERKFVESIARMRLDELGRRGWPRIVVTKGECLTLGGPRLSSPKCSGARVDRVFF